jgi:flagellar motor component MotA
MAVLSTLIGLIAMLRSLDSPDPIGLAIVVALLPVLYAVILSEVFFALAYKAFSRQSDQENSKPLSAKGIALLMAVVGLILVRFCLAIVADSYIIKVS